MRKTYKLLLLLILGSSTLFAGTTAKEITILKDRATGGIYNSSAKIVIESGAFVVVSGGNYQSEGNAGVADAGTLKLTGNLVNNNTSGNPISTTGTVVFNGSSQQEITGDLINFGNITLSNSSGLSMSCAASVGGNLTLTNGNLNLNGQTITLGSAASLSESGGKVYGTTGQIQTTRDLGSLTSEDIAGLGAEITTTTSMGTTTIIRGHTQQSGDDWTGIRRYYDINPTTNSGLDANFVFHYDDSDISGYTESDLKLWKSEDDGSNWAEIVGTVNVDNNTVTVNGIGSFSLWTVTDSDHSLPVTLSSFTAAYINSASTLSWTTQSENSNLGWNIYRGNSNYLELAQKLNHLLIPGAGTSSLPTSYTYQDENDLVFNSTYWYWLESLSNSGETHLYEPVALLIVPEEEDEIPELPQVSILHNNYPNPFNPATQISFDIREGETGELTIINVKGQTISIKEYEAGSYSINWDGSKFGSGIYFYSMKTPSYHRIEKMVMVK